MQDNEKNSGNVGGLDSFLRNPQFLVALADPDLEDENATSTVVISLSQKVFFIYVSSSLPFPSAKKSTKALHCELGCQLFFSFTF